MVLQFVKHHAWLGDSLGPAGTGKMASGEFAIPCTTRWRILNTNAEAGCCFANYLGGLGSGGVGR